MARGAHQKRGGFRREPKEFEEQVIQIDRVTKVVKGGRRLRFRATVVVGNKKGKVGIGIGKSREVTGAIQKGITKAKKEMATITLDGSTIPHDLTIKLKASHILLLPAAPGTGIIAGGTIRKVLELAGVKDILSKSYGTTNKVNNTKAIFKALTMLRETPRMVQKAKNAKAAATKPAPKLETKTETKSETKPEAKKEVKSDDNAKKGSQEPKTPVKEESKKEESNK